MLEPVTPSRLSSRALGWWIVAVLSFVIAIYGLLNVVLGERIWGNVLAESFRARPWGIYPHAFFGMILIAVGPFQFRRSLLRNRRSLHRTLGKVYVVCGVLTGLTGLYMAAYSYGGWITHLGFGGMALAILTTTGVAYRKIRAGDVAAHRAWMIRSYAVVFSAVTLRLWLPILIFSLGGFNAAYLWVAWLSWVPNLMWAEWYLRRRSRRIKTVPTIGARTAPTAV